MTKAVDNISIEYLKKTYSYDPATGDLVHKRLNRKMENKNKNGYILYYPNSGSKLAHRAVWAIHYGKWPEGEIDHINLDRSDNRISNLRIASRSENMANQKKHKKWAKIHSQYKGVYWNGFRSIWMARCAGKTLGYFKIEEEAKAAYDEYAKNRFGVFYHV